MGKKQENAQKINFEIIKDEKGYIEQIIGTPATCKDPSNYITVGRGYSTLADMKSALEALKKYAAEVFRIEEPFHLYTDVSDEGRSSKTLGLVRSDHDLIVRASQRHSKFVVLDIPGYGKATLRMPITKRNNQTVVAVESPWLSIRMITQTDGKLMNTDLGENRFTATYSLHMYLSALEAGQPIHVWATRTVGRNGEIFDAINQKATGLEPLLYPVDKNGNPVPIDAARIRKEDREIAEAYWQQKNAKRKGAVDQYDAEQTGAITEATGVTVTVNGKKMDAIEVPNGLYQCVDDNGVIARAVTRVANDAHRRGLRYLATGNGGVNLISK